MSELTENSSSINIASANYKNYTGSINGTDINYLKSAILPISINTSDNKSAVSIFEFNVLSDNDLITSKVVSVKCKDCSTSAAATDPNNDDDGGDNNLPVAQSVSVSASPIVSSSESSAPPPLPTSSAPPPSPPPSSPPPPSYGY